MRQALSLISIMILAVGLAILPGCSGTSAYKDNTDQQETTMTLQQAEIAEIINNPEAATFDNTIVALDVSGTDLAKVRSVFGAMSGALTSPELQAIAKKLAPLTSKHRDSILLNDELFQRVASVYENRSTLKLNREQEMLLEETYKGFVRGGANLNSADKSTMEALNGELALLTLQFGENVLGDTNDFSMTISNEEHLAGLPAGVIAAAAETAAKQGQEGSWTFTIHKPSPNREKRQPNTR